MEQSVLDNATALIGNTPTLLLDRLYPGPGRLYAKVEMLQPGGSVKDRLALAAVREAYADGRLVPKQPVVEMTSGNTGAGLAVVCNVTANPFIAVMSAGQSPARAHMLEGLGALVELVPQVDGEPGMVTGADIAAAVERARAIAAQRDAFYVDQFNNPAAVRAHEQGTGPEIWRTLGPRLDAFVAAVGTGGTFVGCSRYLKRQKSDIRCIAVEPAGAPALAGRPVAAPRHLLQGVGYGFVPPHWDPAVADATVAVSDDEASAYRRHLARKEGLYVGYSSAANICAAMQLMASGDLGASPRVVTVLCDTGLKY